MNSLTNAAKLMALVISVLTNAFTVSACGMTPPGQASTRSFSITGFTLPPAMVYSTNPSLPARFPGIANSEGGARTFVSRVVMQAVIDVLEQQGRSAGLSDDIIAIILGQLTVRVDYTPLQCEQIIADGAANMNFRRGMMVPHCIVVGNTVTSICGGMMDAMCQLGMPRNIEAIPAAHMTISGMLSTTNIIMANWSTAMWQGVVNRAVRMLASGPFGTNFATAHATVN